METITPEVQAEQPAQPVFTIQGRDYTAETATTKVQSQDTHIRTLEQENKELREKISNIQHTGDHAQKLDEILGQLQQPEKAPETPQGVAPALTDSQLSDKIRAEMQAQAQRSTAEANLNSCSEAAKRAFGDTWEAALTQKGAELGFDQANVNALMLDNPTAFNNLFIPKQPTASVAPRASVAPSAALQGVPQKFPNATRQWGANERLAAQQSQFEIVKQDLISQGKIPA